MPLYDFIIVGAGVIGTSVAKEISERYPKATIAVIEKESVAAEHQSGRNSGIIHAGFYYSADSLKAKLCRNGNRVLKEYCKNHKIPVKECGKVIVTKNEDEIKYLYNLKERAEKNGVDVKLISAKELRDIEPYARTHELALYSPTTAAMDPVEITESFANDARRNGVDFIFNEKVVRIDDKTAITTKSKIRFRHLINCAGAYADKIAHMFGIGEKYRIIPFRGDYYKLSENKTFLVNSNIYPVPDLRNPFLGVHFSRTIHDDVIVGPTAMPVFGRENYYGIKGANLGELFSILVLESKLFFTDSVFRDIAKDELWMKIKKVYAEEASKIVNGISADDLVKGRKSGIRAQLYDTEKNALVQDFVIEHTDNSTHILNAVSPAFTCSLPFAKYVTDEIEQHGVFA